MEYRKINGTKIPVIGIGTWDNGEPFDADVARKWKDAITYAMELGMTHIDTAEFYGNGLTEQIIGEAIKPFKREDLFITSKVWTNHLDYKGTLNALQASLKRLKTKYLDLYLIHRPSEQMNLKETMKALEHLQQNGLARAIGVSNFTKKQILESKEYLDRSDISAVQNEYNILNRNEDILDFCKSQKILFIAYRPLNRGQLSKKGVDILDRLAEKYRKTQSQAALNWLISKPQVITIPKSTNMQHLAENLGCLGWQMDKSDYNALDSISKEA